MDRPVDINYSGNAITLPEGMSVEQAVRLLIDYDKEQGRQVAVSGMIKAHPMDVAHAFTRVVAERYGWVGLRPSPGFWGNVAPNMISVSLGNGEDVRVPWGNMAIPGITGTVSVGVKPIDTGAYVGFISFDTIRRDEEKARELINATRSYVAKNSIFRGRAFRMAFTDADGDRVAVPDHHWIDLSGIDASDLVLPTSVYNSLEDSLWTPIRFYEACKRHGAPTRRGILLEGPYGTGKTLAASVTARIATESGWTFMYLSNVSDIPHAMEVAEYYGPTVVFAEDVDRVAGSRDETLQKIMNSVDGACSKNQEVILVLTTNHVDRIHEGLLRHGRIDDCIRVPPADAECAERLVRVYCREFLEDGTDLTEVGRTLSGLIPAAIREVVELAKYSAIRRMAGVGRLTITEEDLLRTAQRVLASPVRLSVMRGEVSGQHDRPHAKAVV